MIRTKIVKVGEDSYKLSVPTMRTSILVESQIANLTRGTYGIMSVSTSKETQDTLTKLRKLARLDALVSKQKLESGELVDDYSFSFFDLDELEGAALVDKLSEELDTFIQQFRKSTTE